MLLYILTCEYINDDHTWISTKVSPNVTLFLFTLSSELDNVDRYRPIGLQVACINDVTCYLFAETVDVADISIYPITHAGVSLYLSIMTILILVYAAKIILAFELCSNNILFCIVDLNAVALKSNFSLTCLE